MGLVAFSPFLILRSYVVLRGLVVLLLQLAVLRLGCGFAVSAGEPTTAIWTGGILTETPQISVRPWLPHLFLRDGFGPLRLWRSGLIR